MCELLERQYESAQTRSIIVSAMLKLASHIGNGFYPPVLQEAVEKYQNSSNVDTQQRSYEFARLVQDPSLLRDVLPRFCRKKKRKEKSANRNGQRRV